MGATIIPGNVQDGGPLPMSAFKMVLKGILEVILFPLWLFWLAAKSAWRVFRWTKKQLVATADDISVVLARAGTDHDQADPRRRLYERVTGLVYFTITFALLATSGWIVIRTTLRVLDSSTFAEGFPVALGGIILTVIILELLETVFKQVTQTHERLTLQLVNNFFVIGAVSAIRHILVIGAELSIPDNPTLKASERNQLLGELRTNVLLIGVLIGGILIITLAESKGRAFPWYRSDDLIVSRTRHPSASPRSKTVDSLVEPTL